MPFLRYSRDQIIGAMIEAQLRRVRVKLPNRFELESNQSVIGMVAEGSGWAITTAAGYVRGQRFHGRVRLHPFPGRGFARTLSLFTTEVYPQSMTLMISGALRRLITRHFVDPLAHRVPWLQPEFRILGDAD